MGSYPLQTERLDLVPFTAEAMDALIGGDGAHLGELTGARFPEPPEAPPLMADALPFMRDRLREAPEDAPWWAWLVTRRDTGEAVGAMGFAGAPDPDGNVTVGYSVYPSQQGSGFAGEAVTALVAWALRQAGVERVRATIPPGNGPSLRVAAKAGMTHVGDDTDPEEGTVQVWERSGSTAGA